jgi:D-glycero-D-manno-heptose 1,7-bisphosphate phosphatase
MIIYAKTLMLIILDRDGVVNEDSDDYIKTPDEWMPIPGSLQAIADLNHAGHQVVIATNQSGIARGLYTENDLTAIHLKMIVALAEVGGHIDGIFYCSHHPEENCKCRKPQPGMLIQIAQQFKINLQDALLIGDAERDITCAQAVHCPAWLLRTGKGMRTLASSSLLSDVPVFDDLSAAVSEILSFR